MEGMTSKLKNFASVKLKFIHKYDSLGWKVIPLQGKRPFWKNWSDIRKWRNGEYSNEKTLQSIKKDPKLNIGVLTGEPSGIIAIDVDQPHVAKYDPRPAIEMGALAHTTSKAYRLIFRSSNPEVLNFSKKVVRKREELKNALLVGNVENKEEITIVEILGNGRQFVIPPSIHPETGEPYEWVTPLPKDPRDILEVKDLKHLKQILFKIFGNKAIILDLFGFKGEMERKAEEQKKEIPKTTLDKWLKIILKHLEKHIAKDGAEYILLHCPFHPPDEHPSFAIYKNTYLAIDFHDEKIYKLRDLAEALNIPLPKPKRRKINNVAWIPLNPPKEEGSEEVKEGEVEKPTFGWLKIERIDEQKYLVSIVQDNKVVVPARQVGPDFPFKPSIIKYLFGHIKKEIGDEKFNPWLGELQEKIRKKLTYLVLKLPAEKEEEDPASHFDFEVLREEFGISSVQEAREIFNSIVPNPINPAPNHSAIAEFLMERFVFKTLEDSEEILYYENGVYKFNGEQKIKELVQKLLTAFGIQHIATKKLVEEVVEFIKRSTYISIKEFYRFDESHLINLKNGVLDPETLELYPHSPDYLFLWQLPVKYDPLAKAPKIEKFLSQIVAPEDVETLLRIAAYPLMPGQPFQVGIFLVGSGSNGKSTFLNLLKALYGPENVSALSLHDLETNRFASFSLLGKLANICADIPSKPLDKIEIFKAITGGDSLQVEKKFKQSFTVPYIRAKLIFSANKLPELSEYTYAALRRFVIVRFPYKFEGSKANPRILDELTTEEELSGFLNMILDAYIRLKREGFRTKGVEEVHKDWVRWASPLQAFVLEHIEPGEGEVAKDDIWEAFYAYCRKHNIPFPFVGEGAKKSFFKHLRRILRELDIEITETRPTTNDGKRIRALSGIKLVKLEELVGEPSKEEEEYNPNIEAEVVNILSMQPMSFDELMEATGIPEHKLRNAILRLENAGIVYATGGKYIINAKKAKEAGFDIVEVIQK